MGKIVRKMGSIISLLSSNSRESSRSLSEDDGYDFGSSIRNPVSAPSPPLTPAEFASPSALPSPPEFASQPPQPQPQAGSSKTTIGPTEKGMISENLLFSGDWAIVDGCLDHSPNSSRTNSCSSCGEMETELRRRSEVESVLRHEMDSEETSRCTSRCMSRGEEGRDALREEEECNGNVKRDGLREDGQGHVRWRGLHAS